MSAPVRAQSETMRPSVSTQSPTAYSPTRSSGSSPSRSGETYDSSVIPPSHDYRTLVLCFDGTGDQFDADNSNIVQFFSMLKKDDRNQQMVYYQAGIGTCTIPQIATPIMAKLSKLIDEAVANNLNAHVMAGYEFLMENYHAEDKICIFGFSRGAYTARALAGMIQKVGLLPAGNHQQVAFAYKMFMRDDKEGWEQSRQFKKAFSVDVEIEFLGVWDTVASVGLVPRHLPFTKSNKSVRFFRHAMSLDEHRAKFKVSHWQRASDEEEALGTQEGDMPRSNQRGTPPRTHPNHHWHHSKSNPGHHAKLRQEEGGEEGQFDDGECDTNVLEVWFAGCHCDVGGGSVKNNARNSLARIPLRWMIRQCFLAGTGIQFHRSAFARIGIDPRNLYPFVVPRPPALTQLPTTSIRDQRTQLTDGSLVDENKADRGEVVLEIPEEEEDLRDALCKVYDPLELAKAWWLLEYIPFRHSEEKHDHSVGKFRINRGRGRHMPKAEQGEHIVRVHRTVKVRMNAAENEIEGAKGKYKPMAKYDWDGEEPTWVD